MEDAEVEGTARDPTAELVRAVEAEVVREAERDRRRCSPLRPLRRYCIRSYRSVAGTYVMPATLTDRSYLQDTSGFHWANIPLGFRFCSQTWRS